jgi:hypothetical protein
MKRTTSIVLEATVTIIHQKDEHRYFALNSQLLFFYGF